MRSVHSDEVEAVSEREPRGCQPPAGHSDRHHQRALTAKRRAPIVWSFRPVAAVVLSHVDSYRLIILLYAHTVS